MNKLKECIEKSTDPCWCDNPCIGCAFEYSSCCVESAQHKLLDVIVEELEGMKIKYDNMRSWNGVEALDDVIALIKEGKE